MNGDFLLAGAVLVASWTVIGGTIAFSAWAVQHFARLGYRRLTRRHLYVPVEAQVTQVLYHGPQSDATVHVAYAHGGAVIDTRPVTTPAVARLGEWSKRVRLRIDPAHPTDVLVDPQFEAEAAADPIPAAWGRPPGTSRVRNWAVIVLLGLVVFGIEVLGLNRPGGRSLDVPIVFGLTVGLPATIAALWLIVSPRIRSRGKRHQPADGRNGTAVSPSGGGGEQGGIERPLPTDTVHG